MTQYAVGDIEAIIEINCHFRKISFDPSKDELWVADLIIEVQNA